MWTSTTPPSGVIALKNRFEPSSELRLFLHIATRDLSSLGPQFSKERKKLLDIGERLDAGTFRLAVFGAPGSGKRTLVNALLGESLLPTSTTSLIGSPIALRFGVDPGARVWCFGEEPPDESAPASIEDFFSLLWSLSCKDDNFQCGRQAIRVEIQHPAPILRQGIAIVLLPAIDPDSMSQAEMSVDTLSQCDAILFVVSAAGSYTGIDTSVLHDIQHNGIPIIVVLNKVDELGKEEEETVGERLRKAIQADMRLADNVPIFSISARRGLAAKLSDDWSLWRSSGLRAVEDYVTSLLFTGHAPSFRQAIGKDLVDIIEATLIQIRLGRLALELPADSLRAQLSVLENELKNFERQGLLAKTALSRDLKSVLNALEEAAEALRRSSKDYLWGIVEECLGKNCSGASLESVVQDRLAQAIVSFFGGALREMSGSFDHRVSETLSVHRARAERLAQCMFQSAARLFNVPCPSQCEYPSFEMKRKPYWVLRKWTPVFPRLVPENWIERLLPVKVRKKRLAERLSTQVDALVAHNVENLRWALYQNVKDSFRRFAVTLDERFLQVIVATRGTIEAACLRRACSEQTADNTSQFASAEAGLEDLRNDIRNWVNRHGSQCESTAGIGPPLNLETSDRGCLRDQISIT